MSHSEEVYFEIFKEELRVTSFESHDLMQSCVAFGEKTRILGVAAKNQMVTNMKNTCLNFKRLVGRQFRDPHIREELQQSVSYKVIEQKDGSIGIVVNYQTEEHTFSPTQLTAMLFTKLKLTAEIALGTKVTDVVIGVPCFYDNTERHAMIEAASIAGLNVLRLMNETTAVALAYGIYKQDLPAAEEKPRNVVFVDCGQANLQVSVVAFNKGKLKMLTTTAHTHLGGRDFDNIIADYFSKEFRSKYKIDVKNNPRAWTRLLTEVEKIKKQMSANSTELPMNIECFMNDIDVTGKIKRVDMEELAVPLLRKVETTLAQGLASSGLKLDEIYSVEVVGGSSRVPAIKHLIEKIYKKIPSTTLNADEAVARGCALQCAMLSPTFKVREFSITDVQPYSIKLVWQDDSGQEADMEVFPENHQIPFSKLLTFYRKSPFTLQAQYTHSSRSLEPVIGHFTVQDVKPTPEGENQKVKVKVRVNIHGIFTVSSATLTEKKEIIEDDVSPPMETDEKENGPENDNKQEESIDGDAGKENNLSQEQKMETDKSAEQTSENLKNDLNSEKKVKKITKTIDLPVAAMVRNLPSNILNTFIENEAQMVQADKLECERINAKNAVEEYVYEMRSKICEELEKFINKPDRSQYARLLDSTENWLYEDGDDCSKQIYLDKLDELKKLGEPIKTRRIEREELPHALESLLSSIQRARKVVEGFKAGDEPFNHLDSAEMEKVVKAIHERQQWVDKNMGALSVTPFDKDVPVTSQQVRSEKGTFDALVNPIINKPKPKPKVEDPPAAAPEESPMEDEKKEAPLHNGPSSDESKTKGSKTSEESMDVD